MPTGNKTPQEGFLLVAPCRGPAREPSLFLVGPAARRPRRLPRAVTDVFDGMVRQGHDLLDPRPIIDMPSG